MTPRPDAPTAIAVTGLACRFPGAPDAAAFWDMLVAERDGLTRLSDARLAELGVRPSVRRDPHYVPVAGIIDGQDLFDPAPFGLTDAEAALLDPQQRLFLECAWRALEEAGHGGGTGAGAVGVFAGAAQSAYLAANLADRWDPTGAGADPVGSLQTAIATQTDYLPSQTAYRLDLTGPAVAVNTACSTSLVAVHMAVQALLAGECDTALAGGASLIVPQGRGYLHTPDGIYAADGVVRPFSAHGTGVVYTQGVGAVVLRRLRDALDDGDPVLAVVHGSAVNNDGAAKAGFTAPSVRGQAQVLAEALAVAGAEPRHVGYVEAHGTGTRLGDPIETAALRRVYGDTGPAWCGLGSVKSNIGHANSAAGIASFIKTVLALRNAVIPASLHAEPVNELLGLAGSPFEVVTRTRAWDGPELAGVSSFGIGGTNAHVILGPAPQQQPGPPDGRPQVLPLAAFGRDALTASAARLADAVPGDGTELADLAHTLQSGRSHAGTHRLAAVAGSGAAAAALRSAAPVACDGTPPRLLFAFPGGGSQRPGMGADLYRDEPVFAACVDECAELLHPLLGHDIRAFVTGRTGGDGADDPPRALPALFAVSLATARLLESWGVRPDAVLGHSLGEYTAAVAAGALRLADAVRLVAVRATAMSDSAGRGGMLALPLPEDAVVDLLARHPGIDLAAVNAPDACVVSGPRADLAELDRELRRDGVEPTRVRVDAAAHSRLVDPAVDRVRAAAAGLTAAGPAVPVVSTLTGEPVSGTLGTPEHWARQLREPVRFARALRTAVELDESRPALLLQVGPGAALATLARRNALPRLRATATTLATEAAETDPVAVRAAAAAVWTHGAAVDFAAMHRPGRRRVAAPGYAFQHRRLWIDPPTSRPGGDAPDVDDPLQVPVWTQCPPLEPGTELAGRWLLAGPPTPDAAALRTALAAAGADVVDLTDAEKEPSGPWAGAVVVADADGDAHDPESVTRRILAHADLARILAGCVPAPPLLLQVSRAVERVESADRAHPAAAVAQVLPRVLAQEQTGLVWRTLDVGPDTPLAPAVLAELRDLAAGGEPGVEAAVRGGVRWTRGVVPWRPGAAAVAVDGSRAVASKKPVSAESRDLAGGEASSVGAAEHGGASVVARRGDTGAAVVADSTDGTRGAVAADGRRATASAEGAESTTGAVPDTGVVRMSDMPHGPVSAGPSGDLAGGEASGVEMAVNVEDAVVAVRRGSTGAAFVAGLTDGGPGAVGGSRATEPAEGAEPDIAGLPDTGVAPVSGARLGRVAPAESRDHASGRAPSAAVPEQGNASVAVNGGQGSVAVNGGQGSVAVNGGQGSVAVNGGQGSVAVNGGQGSVAVNQGGTVAAATDEDNGTALIIGGLGDVGLTMAAHLAAQGMRVVLTSRSAPPAEPAPGGRDAERALALHRLADAGTPVEVRVLDAADTAATAGLLAELAGSSGPGLRLVVHAAGVVATADLAPMRAVTTGHVTGHVRSKVAGALALRAAVAALPPERRPETVLLMSSAGTLVGGIGMGPYCAVNAFLDALAAREAAPAGSEEPGTRWLSAVWDAWRVGPLGEDRVVNLDFALDAATGMAALDRMLAAARAGTAPPVVAVSSTDLRVRMAEAARPVAVAEDTGAADGDLGPVERAIADLWTELFGTPVRSAAADFFALGGHSLLATRMLAALRRRFGTRLTLRDVLAEPTLGGLAALVADRPTEAPTPAALPPTAAPAASGGPGTFPMTRVQHAYWVGRDGGYAYGDVACHFYLEYDCEHLDLDRYERAWNAVIGRHPMLRAVTTPDGRMRVLDRLPHYRIRVHDLTGHPAPRRAERLARLRDRISRRPGPSDRWPLFQVQAARLPDGHIRLFIGVDVLICDAASYWIVDREVQHYYEHPDEPLPEPGVEFADCVAALDGRADPRRRERAADYWRDRLDTLPDAPALPVRPDAGPNAFVRRAARLDTAAWDALRTEAARRGVTPTAVLLTAYAETLADWSGDARFAVTLTLFDRPDIHPRVNDVVGDFTSLLLHEADLDPGATFAERVRRTHRRLFTDLDHREFSALDVLAERASRTGRVASVPVVFTSALGLEDVIGGERDLQWVGRQVHALSQTPQTWLDHQALVQRGELLLQWDALVPALPPEEVDRVFAAYVERIRRLAADPAGWDAPADGGRPAAPPSPPAPATAVRARAEALLPLRSGAGERPLFLVHPSGGDVLCYADLARGLDPRFEVVAVTDPALVGGDAPEGFADLAGAYVELVRGRQPSGPYLLGGWSMGGSLAQEMACRLHEQGEAVELLLMFDSNDPTHIVPVDLPDPEDARGETIARHLGALEAYLGVDLGVGDGRRRAALVAMAPERRWAEVERRLREHRLLGRREEARDRVRVFERHMRALAGHVPRRLAAEDTTTLVVRAERSAPRNSGIGMGVDDTPPGHADLGWGAHLAGPLEVAAVDADHYSLLRPPAVDRLAELVNRSLRGVRM
ncbi:beta-ketoacyl synthase N-terminal-like domain-containing protein [Marinactinospora rubrisoli]|uniref:Beta-ketoacyl synthase N-terminal-like domain-containing protein n=1 Tax=Marinactinospora rubrisoli TaxID=2715399 RepID=A0ABW2KII4_9ACTN